jgi:signal transduction histidine kinase/DNA-binding response OmpR family regulator
MKTIRERLLRSDIIIEVRQLFGFKNITPINYNTIETKELSQLHGKIIIIYSVCLFLLVLPFMIIFTAANETVIALLLALISLVACINIVIAKHQYKTIARIILIAVINSFFLILLFKVSADLAERLILPLTVGWLLLTTKQNRASLITLAICSLSMLVLTTLKLLPYEESSIIDGDPVKLFTSVYVWLMVGYSAFQFKQVLCNRLKSLSVKRSTEIDLKELVIDLIHQKDIKEIITHVLKKCVAKLNLSDCVIYLLDKEKNEFFQHSLLNNNEIEVEGPLRNRKLTVGEGIVGHAAQMRKTILVNDTSHDYRYIRDNFNGASELSVPIFHDDQLIGVIDSESTEKNFYTSEHIKYLEAIAAILGNRIAKQFADDELKIIRLQTIETESTRTQNKFKSDLYSNLAHEFKTPLTLILDIIGNLENEQIPEQVSCLERNAQQVLGLVNQLLDISKAENDSFKLNLTTENVSSILEDLCRNFQTSAKKKSLVFTHNIAPKIITEIDSDLFTKISTNLISNAIRYTSSGNAVFVKAQIKNSVLLLSIGDSGIGMSSTEVEQIYNRYFTADSSNEQNKQSTGLGLSITKEMVQLHGGTIEVQSKEDCGTMFIVKIPVTQNEANILSVEDYDQFNKEKIRKSLLIVEDNTDFLFYLKDSFSDYNVFTADSGEEALALVYEHTPDLILTDHILNKKSGLDIVHILKNNLNTAQIPIIMMSGIMEPEIRTSALKLGVNDFVSKPFRVNDIKLKIDNILNRERRYFEKINKEILTKSISDLNLESADKKFIQSVINLVNENIDNSEFSVIDLQDSLGLSRMQVHRKIKSIANSSTTEFVRTIRIKRACELIKNECDNISQIAYSVGFSSLSYFSKAFKEVIGISPTEFARNNKLEEKNVA